MFYKIKDTYQLVGWRNLPTGIHDISTNTVSFLPREEYGTLLHMNGQENISSYLNPEQQEKIDHFLENGTVQADSRPFPKSNKSIYRYFDNIRVKSVHWSLTGKCNYKCRHCFVSAPICQTEDMSTEECLKVIRQLADCGIWEISFTGGEPLIRADFPQLIQECSNVGIRITELHTNGSMLTPEVLQQFIRTGQNPRIQVSYDGVGWHDWVRGHAGAQQAAENALQSAYEAGLKTCAAMSLFRDNVPAIRQTVQRLAALHVHSIKISPMFNAGLWGKDYAEKTLTDEAFLSAVLDYIPSFFSDGKPCSLSMGGYFDYNKEQDIGTSSLAKNPSSQVVRYPCPWISSNLYIDPAGTVLPCMEFSGRPDYAQYPSLLQTPLREILQDSVVVKTMKTTLDEVYSHNVECQNCPERGKHCGKSCRACAVPDYCGIDPGTCRFIKNKWFREVQTAVEKAGGVYTLF